MQVHFVVKEGLRERYEIIIDGEKWRDVHRTVFGAKPRFPTIPIGSDVETLFDEYEYRRTKNYALWRLSKQSYHSEQLSKMLRERLVQEKTIHRVLTELQEAGFLNDEAWLNAFINSQQKRYGLPIILSKLRLKGISRQTIQQLSENCKDPDEEMRAIQHLLQTRYRSKDLKDYKTRQKVFAALMRKGFTIDQIKLALQTLIAT